MRQAVIHTLKVKCPTWDHVENFYARKVKAGGALSARVPFHPRVGEIITLALELPDELVIAIDGEVLEAAPAPDGKKSAVRMRLFGLTDAVRGRLEALVADARRQRSQSGPLPVAAEELSPPTLPPALPIDAPVDELVEPVEIPAAADVPEAVRPVFEQLAEELRAMKEAAAHEVLGVAWDAGVEEIRAAYVALGRRLHPDVFARHRSPEVHLIAIELFIHINRAYDRMRDAAVASGSAIAPGPALLPHRGWMAEFDDIGTQAKPGGTLPRTHSRSFPAPGSGSAPTPAPARSPSASPSAPPAPPASSPAAARPAASVKTPTPVPFTADALFGEAAGKPAADGAAGAEPPAPAEVLAAARAQLAAGQFAPAREALAALLRRDPRNRTARALYHLASARLLGAEGKKAEATTQLEVAAAHDPDCAEVREAVAAMKTEAVARGGILRRLFR